MSITTMWVALIVFALLLTALGILGNRGTSNTMEDYVLGSRQLGSFAAFFTVTATLFSAFSYFGIIGQYYSDGIGSWIQVATTAVAGPLIYFAGTRIWLVARKYGFLNVTEYLSDRFNSKSVGLIAGIIMIGALVPYMGAQFRGSGITLEAVTDGQIPFWVGSVFLATIVTLYVMAGGFRSVVWTDIVQGAMMYILLGVAMLVLVFSVNGGFSGLMDAVKSETSLMSNPGENGLFSLPYLISVLIIFAAAHFTMPQLQQRWMAAKDHKTIKFTAISLPIGTGIIYLFGFYIAMVGVVKLPDLVNPESVYPALIMDALPEWLLVLAIIAIITATGSTANSIVLTLASIVANEYIRDWVSKRRGAVQTDRLVTSVSRALLPALVGGGLLIAFFGPPTVVSIIVDITWPAVFLIFPTLIAGLYWRRATAAAAVASMVISEIVFISLTMGWLPINIYGWHPAIPSAILGIAILVLGSFATSPPSHDHVERHFKLFEKRDAGAGALPSTQ